MVIRDCDGCGKEDTIDCIKRFDKEEKRHKIVWVEEGNILIPELVVEDRYGN